MFMNQVLNEVIRFIGRFALGQQLARICRKNEQHLWLALDDCFQRKNQLSDLIGIFNLSDQGKDRLGAR